MARALKRTRAEKMFYMNYLTLFRNNFISTADGWA